MLHSRDVYFFRKKIRLLCVLIKRYWNL